jgi:hypothetical protein
MPQSGKRPDQRRRERFPLADEPGPITDASALATTRDDGWWRVGTAAHNVEVQEVMNADGCALVITPDRHPSSDVVHHGAHRRRSS